MMTVRLVSYTPRDTSWAYFVASTTKVRMLCAIAVGDCSVVKILRTCRGVPGVSSKRPCTIVDRREKAKDQGFALRTAFGDPGACQRPRKQAAGRRPARKYHGSVRHVDCGS